jgi:hypothetical protein
VGEDDLGVENLLLASLLIAGGARLRAIDSGPRLSTVRLVTTNLDRERLSDGLARLAQDVGEMDQEPSIEEWNWLFDSSILGTIESEYRRLKRLVVNQRSKG